MKNHSRYWEITHEFTLLSHKMSYLVLFLKNGLKMSFIISNLLFVAPTEDNPVGIQKLYGAKVDMFTVQLFCHNRQA